MKKFHFNPRKWLKGMAPAVLLTAVGVGGWFGYQHFFGENEPVQAAVMQTAMVTRGNLEVTISGTGSIEPVNTKTVVAGTSGTLEKVLVEVGDTVKEGDVLAVFETTDRTSQIRQKELELQRSLLDFEQMYKQFKTADEEARESILLNIEKLKLSIEMAEEELRELRESAEAVEITAPIGGKITQLNVKTGDNVNANTVVAEIVDYSRLQITVPIDELDIVDVEIGQQATILVDAFPGEVFSGTVTDIADQGSYNNGVATFDVTVLIDDPGSLKSGMSAEASIQVAFKENVLLLPVDAVQSMGGRYFVTVVNADGSAAGDAAAGDGNGKNAGDGIWSGPAAGNDVDGGTRAGPAAGNGGGDRNLPGPAAGSGAGGGNRPGPAASDETGGEAGNGAAAEGGSAKRGGQRGEGMRGTFGNRPAAFGTEEGDETGGNRNRSGRTGLSGNAETGAAGPQNITRVFIEVGISNEDYIEVVSGLNEGDVVILPTTVSSSNGSNSRMQGFGFPGGGFPGGGGGMMPGGFSGGRGGSGGFSGGGR